MPESPGLNYKKPKCQVKNSAIACIATQKFHLLEQALFGLAIEQLGITRLITIIHAVYKQIWFYEHLYSHPQNVNPIFAVTNTQIPTNNVNSVEKCVANQAFNINIIKTLK